MPQIWDRGIRGAALSPFGNFFVSTEDFIYNFFMKKTGSESEESTWKCRKNPIPQELGIFGRISCDRSGNILVSCLRHLIVIDSEGKVHWKKSTKKLGARNSVAGCFTPEGNILCAFDSFLELFDFEGKSLRKKKIDVSSFKQKENPRITLCVAVNYQNGNFAVGIRGDFSEIQIYDKNLNFISRIKSENCFDFPYGVEFDGKGNLVILDATFKDGAHILFLSEKGEFQFSLKHQSAESVTTDIEGNVLVSAADSKILTVYKWS